MKHTCKSGLIGWKSRVRKVYASLAELREYDALYGIVSRLGYDTAGDLWEANPVIGGSVDPADLEVVKA
jgi:hypothetical protein